MLNHGPDSHFNTREQLLSCMTNQVRKAVTNDFQALFITARNQLDAGVLVNGLTGIHQHAIHTAAYSGFG